MIGRTIHDGGIISIFARHPNAANLLMVLMVIFGIFALGKINTQFFPTVEREEVSITVKWTGASPEDIEKNIIEIGLRWLDEIKPKEDVEDLISYVLQNAK